MAKSKYPHPSKLGMVRKLTKAEQEQAENAAREMQEAGVDL